jgi:arsenite/tail-anchored protein-transporting ATPase
VTARDVSAPGGLDALLGRLPKWTLVGGKGGVGKTTCASALALRSASRGDVTLLVSTDPARSLGTAIGEPLGATPREIAGRSGLFAMQLDASAARDAFLTQWREILVTIVDRGTYLDREDIEGLVNAALPGVDETMGLLALAAIEAEPKWRRVIVDTAPTGHTLRLLSLPDTFRGLIGLLDVMQDKHRFMVSALTHRYRGDAADAFLKEMRRQVDALTKTLGDPGRSAAVLVTRPEPVVVAETARYAAALPGLGLTLAAVIVNAMPATLDEDTSRGLASLEPVSPEVPRFVVPRLESAPIGIEAIETWGLKLSALGSRRSAERVARKARVRAMNTPSASQPKAVLPIRSLTIVGGKGGVGKTTTACALALLNASPATPTLIVSTDPAPSIGDALGMEIGDAEIDLPEAPGLHARQIDATAAFDRMRREYRDRVDSVFQGLMGPGIDAPHDRRILRDLLSFAPPGVDEVYALAQLGETLEEARYSTIIVDPAPTGHLLRLLEMPAIAIDWTHRLLRLMLKYKELTSLGDAAAELLAFAKRTKAVAALLHDAERAGLLVVALDEPLVRAETVRLVGAVRERAIDVIGVFWNRAVAEPAPLDVEPPVRQFVAPACVPPPTGIDAIRAWASEWRELGGANA